MRRQISALVKLREVTAFPFSSKAESLALRKASRNGVRDEHHRSGAKEGRSLPLRVTAPAFDLRQLARIAVFSLQTVRATDTLGFQI